MALSTPSWPRYLHGSRRHSPRTFHDLLSLLQDTHLDLSSTPLALLTSVPDQYHLFQSSNKHLPRARLSIFLGKSFCANNQVKLLCLFIDYWQRYQPNRTFHYRAAKRSSNPAKKNQMTSFARFRKCTITVPSQGSLIS
jgi:hypothetical protein